VKFAIRPYNLFLPGGLLLLFVSVFIHAKTLDINLHDTYFVISMGYLCWIFCVIQILLWGLYKLFTPILFSIQLIWTHILVTILTLDGIVLFSWWAIEFYNPRPRRYIDYTHWDTFKTGQYTREVIVLVLTIFILTQLIFVINIIQGLLKKST